MKTYQSNLLKIKSQRNHSKLRVSQRYGVLYNRYMKRDLVKMIQEGSDFAVFLNKRSNRISIFALYYNDIWFAVMYDRDTKEIATFLPRSYLYLYRKRIEC